jgi:hypothetical protein
VGWKSVGLSDQKSRKEMEMELWLSGRQKEKGNKEVKDAECGLVTFSEKWPGFKVDGCVFLLPFLSPFQC